MHRSLDLRVGTVVSLRGMSLTASPPDGTPARALLRAPPGVLEPVVES